MRFPILFRRKLSRFKIVKIAFLWGLIFQNFQYASQTIKIHLEINKFKEEVIKTTRNYSLSDEIKI